MAGCVANTSNLALSIDAAGTLRGAVTVSPGVNNPLVNQADGLAVKAQHVTYGWPFGGDDTYNAPAGVAPAFGPLVYGPEVLAQTQTVTVGTVTAFVNWEVQAGYTGSNTFSGMQFQLQLSFDHTNWFEIATAAYYQPLSQTVLHHFFVGWPVAFGDNGLHNLWVRCVISAGSFGTGDVATAQFTRHRGITIVY